MPQELSNWVKDVRARFPDLSEWALRALSLASGDPPSSYPLGNVEDLERELNSGTHLGYIDLDESLSELESLSVVDLQTWLCTDTSVGLRALLVASRPVALMFQPARRSDTSFLWFSQNEARFVRQLLRQIAEKLDPDVSPEIVSDSPSDGWVGVRRALLRPEIPEPVVVEMVHPETGQTLGVDVKDLRIAQQPGINGDSLARLMLALPRESLSRISQRDLLGATPGEQFAQFAKIAGPVLAGQAYFATPAQG